MKRKTDVQNFTQKIYFRVVMILAAFHTAYLALFLVIGHLPLAMFNVVSVFLYLSLTLLIKKNQLRGALAFVHIEVVCFVVLSVLLMGWDYDFQYLLMAIASLCYFAPYQSKYTSYLIAIFEAVIFFLLYLHSYYFLPLYPIPLQSWQVTMLSVFNMGSIFVAIVYITFISNVVEAVKNMELSKQNVSLKSLADRDPLTELLNRRGMHQHIQQAYLEYQTTQKPFAIVIGDIDDFKQLNDSYGHDCGDHVLKTLALILNREIRGKDCVSRWGGEEFLLLLHQVDQRSTFEIVARLRQTIEQTKISCAHQELSVTLTFGGSIIQNPHDTIEQMIKRGDQALYVGKKAGKNQTNITD